MESFNGREVSTDTSHAQALNQHLMASAFGSPQVRDRAAGTHPVEPHPTQPAKPIEPPKPTHPVEPPKPTHPVEPPKPTHPVEPPKPTHPVEPPKPPVEPPRPPVEPHPTRNLVSPPAETFHPNKPQKQETSTPPKEEKHTPVNDHPVPEKPVVPIAPPPEKSHTVPPPEKTVPVVPPEKHTPVTPPEQHKKPGELHISIDHTKITDEEHRTIQRRVEHVQSQVDKHKHEAKTSHHATEQHRAEQHQSKQTTHHSDSSHHSTPHHSTHHRPHTTHHTTGHHSDSHHTTHHPTHHKTTHHADTHRADTHHATSHKAEAQHKVVQKDTSHVVDKAQHQEKKKDVDVTTVHVDKKHVEEHTHIDVRVTLPEAPKPVEPTPVIEPPKEPAPAAPKPQEPIEKVQEPPKTPPIEPPTVVPSPPAEPTRVEKPAASHELKPAPTNEVTASISKQGTVLSYTREEHIDPKTYYRATLNAGVSGDHVGLGNTQVMVGRHLFSPYDKNGNPTRGNLNIEGGMVLQTGHTYEYGKLPRFGDTSFVAGVNGYYQPTRDLTLYGAAQRATNPKQYDVQFGAIKDSGRFSFQLGGEVSKVDGYGTSHFVTPGLSYRLNKNTSVYVSGAVNVDGHRERNAAFTGFRVNF
ncbi:MAG: hypothetical protein JST89_11665 [Cyanobacteria bacterium SZAS-4]|nr:hypothetical protein [Cyanobacteria bacterium SZAS-4]